MPTVHLRRDEAVDAEEAVLFRLMIHYLYVLDYGKPSESKMLFASTQTKAGVNQRAELHDSEKSEIESLENELILHSRMYALGDYYQIPELKEAAKKKFEKAVKNSWDAPEFGRAVYIVFTSTPSSDRGLRELVTQSWRDRPGLVDRADLEAVFREVPDLAYDALVDLRTRIKHLQAVCTDCGQLFPGFHSTFGCSHCDNFANHWCIPLVSEHVLSNISGSSS